MSTPTNVLVGLDLNEATAGVILNRACQMATPDNIEVVHVCDHFHHTHQDYPVGMFRTSEDLDAAIRNEADSFLAKFCEPLGIAKHRVADGHAAKVLRESTRSHDLVVMGSHGRHGLAGMFASTSNDVLHGTAGDILAVHIDPKRPVQTGNYKRVLAAVSLAHDSADVIEHAHAVATSNGARLMVCHVSPSKTSQLIEQTMSRRFGDQEHHQHPIRMSNMALAYGIADEDIFELQGNTAKAIHRLAEEVDADLVVVGTHGKHGFELVAGSTANAVLHGATCDALTVKI